MKQISDNDWFLIRERVKSVRGVLCETHNEDRLFDFVWNRTLRFGKFIESVSLSHFKCGVNGTKPPLLGYPRWHWGSLNLAVRHLFARNILAKRARGSGMAPYFFLNVPGILEFLLSLDPKDEMSAALADKVEAVYDESGLSFPGIVQCGEDIMAKLADSIKDAEQRSADALAKRNVKRAKNGNLLWVRNEMKEYCEAEEIKFMDDAWDAKLYGQAKWWVIKCHRSGVDPRVRLREICDKWEEIRKYLRVRHKIHFKSWVSFSQYISQWKRVNIFLDLGDIEDPANFEGVFENAEAAISEGRAREI